MQNKTSIVLASASPRRKELLSSLLGNFGLTFRIFPSDIEEVLPNSFRKPSALVCKIAEEKARSVAKKIRGLIISADTIVVVKDNILGKPKSGDDAKRMLRLLSDTSHIVYTGIFMIESASGRRFSAYERTIVHFRKLSNKEINFYVASGSPLDKAGSYGIQDDFGSTFITKIEGDFFNVVGLPVLKTYTGLKKFLDLGV